MVLNKVVSYYETDLVFYWALRIFDIGVDSIM